MSTSVTATDVRTRWPHLTSTAAISDALLAILITEADNGLASVGAALLIRREDAVTHYAAHKATLTIAASSTDGTSAGPVVSASFLHRSESRSSAASSRSGDPLAADLERTVPGQTLLTLLKSTRRLPGVLA